MDYRSQSARFKLRKVLRYLRLYGPRQTWAKILAHEHLHSTFETLPYSTDEIPIAKPIAILGCGKHSFSSLAYQLHRQFGRVIGAAMDIRAERAASLALAYDVPLHTTDVQQVLDHPNIRMVYIASNHASHAEYAIEALRRDKHVYLEKPHVVNEDQLARLCDAMRNSAGKVFLGFNRPNSRFGKSIIEHFEREPGTAIFNWFVTGHDLGADHWYYRAEEGGRILGNVCHWTDLSLRLVSNSRFPIQIAPTRADKSDSNLMVTYLFGDGSIGAITFSAKGEPFEGVKERFVGHKGDCLLTMDDYQRLSIEIGERKVRRRSWFRDQGHGSNIAAAYRNVCDNGPYDREQMISYIADTGWLFLKTRQALETNQTLTIDSFYQSRVESRSHCSDASKLQRSVA